MMKTNLFVIDKKIIANPGRFRILLPFFEISLCVVLVCWLPKFSNFLTN